MKCIGNVAGGDRASWRVVGRPRSPANSVSNVATLRCGSPQFKSTQSHTPLYQCVSGLVGLERLERLLPESGVSRVKSSRVGGGGARCPLGSGRSLPSSTIDLRTSPATIPVGLEYLLLGRLGALTRPTQLCGELS